MDTRRTRALYLRKQGKSYNEIRREVGVAKSTLSLWLKDVVLNGVARQRIADKMRAGVINGLIKRNKDQTRRAWESARTIRKRAEAGVPQLSNKDLLLIGAVLYWAEGYKRVVIRDGVERPGHKISFVNSDPDMVRVFARFLTEGLGVSKDRIRMTVRLYPHMDEHQAVSYWRRVASLPQSCVRNSTWLVSGASNGKRPLNRLPYGTLQVWVGDTEKFHHLMGLIDGVKNRL